MDEYPLEPREPKGLTCEHCGCTLYAGETYILWHGERYCEDCAAEAVRDELDESGFRFYLDRLADMMGFDVKEAYSR